MERCVCVCTLPFFSSNLSIGHAVMLIVNPERISFSLPVSWTTEEQAKQIAAQRILI